MLSMSMFGARPRRFGHPLNFLSLSSVLIKLRYFARLKFGIGLPEMMMTPCCPFSTRAGGFVGVGWKMQVSLEVNDGERTWQVVAPLCWKDLCINLLIPTY